MHLHMSSFVWNVAQTTSWSGSSDRIYITKRMKWPAAPIYIFMLFFIKMKLSISLCLTHKRVTQKYRNSTLIKKKNKKKLRSDRIGSESADTQNFLDRIGSDLKKWYRCIPTPWFQVSSRKCLVLRGIYHLPLALPLDQNENWDSPYSHVNAQKLRGRGKTEKWDSP